VVVCSVFFTGQSDTTERVSVRLAGSRYDDREGRTCFVRRGMGFTDCHFHSIYLLHERARAGGKRKWRTKKRQRYSQAGLSSATLLRCLTTHHPLYLFCQDWNLFRNGDFTAYSTPLPPCASTATKDKEERQQYYLSRLYGRRLMHWFRWRSDAGLVDG